MPREICQTTRVPVEENGDTVSARSDSGLPCPVPKVALVGAGGFGRHHFTALQTLEQLGECHLVAICDKNGDWPAASETKQNFTRHTSLAALLETGHFDHVVLSTPPHLHQEQACAILERKLSLYLEKPPVTTVNDLEKLMRFTDAAVTVGFQLVHAPCMQALKRLILETGPGSVRRLSAVGLWPRTTWYYQRSPWAGRMTVHGRTVFDGPLTNAFAHLVHAAFFLLGPTQETFALPSEVRARLLRARPIESYDFGRIEGRTTDGIPFEIAAAHCATETLPWTITVEMRDGRRLVLEESQMPASNDLLLACHRAAFTAMRKESSPRSRLSDCIGYTRATSAALRSSEGVHDIPADVDVLGEADDRIHHSPDILHFLRTAITEGRLPRNAPVWLAPGKTVYCPGAGE